MPSMLCQKLVSSSSCLEPQITETTTSTLKLKITNLEHNNNSLDFPHANPNESEKQKISTSTSASSFSLALCTEHLGNETGSDDTVAGMLSPEVLLKQERKKPSRTPAGRSIKSTFPPPPLTTMGSLQVRRHREDGRLMIEAVEAPSQNTCFHAERSDGRLRLYFLTTTSTGGVENDQEERGEEATEEEEEEEMQEEEEIYEPRSEAESKKEGECDGETNMEKGSSEKYQWWNTTSRCKEEEGGSSHGNHLFVGWPLPSY